MYSTDAWSVACLGWGRSPREGDTGSRWTASTELGASRGAVSREPQALSRGLHNPGLGLSGRDPLELWTGSPGLGARELLLGSNRVEASTRRLSSPTAACQ